MFIGEFQHFIVLLSKVSECLPNSIMCTNIPMLEKKPMLRGKVHQAAFIVTCGFAAVYVALWVARGWTTGVAVYILSQMVLYGVSSVYHLTDWKTERHRRLLQRMDHASIFLLISGTQTSVALLLLPIAKATKSILVVTWTISGLGILKVMILRGIYETLDVAIYILHGISVVPFFKFLIRNATLSDVILFICGGVLYIVGGIFFRIRKPDPFPNTFGYHEVFHVFTVAANTCYMIPIFKKYLSIVLVGRGNCCIKMA